MVKLPKLPLPARRGPPRAAAGSIASRLRAGRLLVTLFAGIVTLSAILTLFLIESTRAPAHTRVVLPLTPEGSSVELMSPSDEAAPLDKAIGEITEFLSGPKDPHAPQGPADAAAHVVAAGGPKPAAPGHGDPAGHAAPAPAAAVPAASVGAGGELAPAPISALTEVTGYGVLPVTGPDGTSPFAAYRRPAPAASGAPRIAIVIGTLGLSRTATERTITDLPPEVSLAFLPRRGSVEGMVAEARADGHEVLLHMPMEPFNYPENDPGPQTLLTTLTDEENEGRLYDSLAAFPGFIGLMTYEGARFTKEAERLLAVLERLERRGLMIFDDGASRQSTVTALARKLALPYARADEVVDIRPIPAEIARKLADLETLARRQGQAIGVGSAYPSTIDQVRVWADGLGERGIELVPVSALAAQSADAPSAQASPAPAADDHGGHH